jgi:hypothetical protein
MAMKFGFNQVIAGLEAVGRRLAEEESRPSP